MSSSPMSSEESGAFGLIDRVINEMLSVSTGYFIYDFFDMLRSQKLSQSWELLFHHIVVCVQK